MRPLPPPATNYNVGDTVAGRDCVGSPFRGVVEQRCGPYTLLVDGAYTPTSLIDEIVKRFEPHTHQPGSSLFDGAAAYETYQNEQAETNGGVFD